MIRLSGASLALSLLLMTPLRAEGTYPADCIPLEAGIAICNLSPGWSQAPRVSRMWTFVGPDNTSVLISIQPPLGPKFRLDDFAKRLDTSPDYILRDDRTILGHPAPTFVSQFEHDANPGTLTDVISHFMANGRLMSVTTRRLTETYDATTAASHDAFLGYITFRAE